MMRQALVAGVSALLMAVLLPGWLLPAREVEEREPLVLIVEQPQEKTEEQTLVLRRGNALVELPLETYLIGVVLSEMPASFAPEALKAQAVAARTFALRQMKGGKHSDCDLCADSACCQAWSSRETMEEKLGESSEIYWSKVAQAVRETEGEVLLYEGDLIDAVYFSCSGGRTEDAVAVWGSDVPYLQSVPSEGEETSRVYETEVVIPLEVFRNTVLQAFPQAALSGSPENWLGDTKRTAGGGVDTMEIGGVLVKGTELRQLFRLNSTSFSSYVTEESIVFAVKGHGHRVGMSQYGANAMAELGASYKEILSHYYTGVEIGSAP